MSVWCWYRVGSGDELPGRTGVSHWVEHMNFKGTTNIPRDEMKGIVERFGGTWNGYTWIDQTTYLETAGKDALDTLLFIEAERMAHGLYEPQECESERTVIISELQGGENDPDQLLDTEVTATAFRAHPYRHPTIGWIDDLRSMTRDDLYGHYRRHYVPANATLVVVGDVDTDDVLRRARGALRRRSPAARAPAQRASRGAAADRRAPRAARARRDDRLSEVRVARAGGAPTTDFFPMLVLDAALTGAKGAEHLVEFSRRAAAAPRAALHVARREGPRVGGRRLAAADARAVPLQRRLHRDATACRSPRSRRPRPARSSASRRDGLTEDEVARAKRQLRARLVFETDSVTNVAHQIGYFETVDRARATSTSSPSRLDGRDGRAGRRRRGAPSRARAAHGRLVPAAGAQGVTHAGDERTDAGPRTCCPTAPS